MFAGNFAPRGWALCDGQLLAISGNESLFFLLGTIYGGDGRTTFGLPDLRGRIPIHAGSGASPGLSARPLGQKDGQETTTLTVTQLPSHSHALNASTDAGGESNPAGEVTGESSSVKIYAEETPSVDMNAAAIGGTGGNGSHNNIQPFQCINFIIALFGIFPSQT
jgi:microcystin-dependent protein